MAATFSPDRRQVVDSISATIAEGSPAGGYQFGDSELDSDPIDSYPPPPPPDPRLRVAVAWMVMGSWPVRQPVALLAEVV